MQKKQCFSGDFDKKCKKNNVSRKISAGNAQKTMFLVKFRQEMQKKQCFSGDFDKKCKKNNVSRKISAGNAKKTILPPTPP
jgi:hypothetical protein